jgi:hypothetical protein
MRMLGASTRTESHCMTFGALVFRRKRKRDECLTEKTKQVPSAIANTSSLLVHVAFQSGMRTIK